MSLEQDIQEIAECPHSMSIPYGETSMRCPHCGAMRVGEGPWALPHRVDNLVRSWKRSQETPT